MGEWQDIETAPKDGTTIIICNNLAEEPDPFMAHFRNGKWVCTTKEDWDAGADEFREYAWWMRDPTHWMPRPKPPAISNKDTPLPSHDETMDGLNALTIRKGGRHMSKILDGAKEALAFARGEGQAARITTHVGGPYVQGGQRQLIQHKVADGYIVWNWDSVQWDRVKEPVIVLPADKPEPLYDPRQAQGYPSKDEQ